MTQKSTVVSAPGKVLVCGGYLVLERPYIGVVLSLGARFYTKTVLAENAKEGEEGLVLRIISPQFKSTIEYSFQHELPYGASLKQISAEGKNPYVESTLRVALPVILHRIGKETFSSSVTDGTKRVVQITIRGDNDFYSQQDTLRELGLELSTEALASLPPFGPPTRHDDGSIAKTGLGSSAALVTSLVGSLLAFFGVVSLEKGACLSEEQAVLVHNLAQACHCYAQGKIGSGFDVSSAVYGSQKYVRFSPSLLQHLLPEEDKETRDIASVHKGIVDPWDNSVEAFAMPSFLRVVLGDVCGGSNTPSMVSKVLKWKREGGDQAAELWQKLGEANAKTFELLSSLAKQDKEDSALREKALSSKTILFSSGKSAENNVLSALQDLAERFALSRKLLREVGVSADVPIEPKEQTALLDFTLQVPGVIAAGVPGAGGYDAIFAICIGDETVQEVKGAWATWKQSTVCALPCASRVCGLCEDSAAYDAKALQVDVTKKQKTI